MPKPFSVARWLLLGMLVLLLAGLDQGARGRRALSCAPTGTAFAAGMEAQAAESEADLTDSMIPRKILVHPEVVRIPAEEVKALLARKADVVIVDTNPADSFAMWHIPNAVNLPFVTLQDNPDKRDGMLGTLPKDKLIVLYCLCEEGADSSEVALMLRRMGYRRDRIRVLEGGLIQWDARGYPMIKTEEPE